MWRYLVQVAAVAVPIRASVVLRWEAVSAGSGFIGGTSGVSPRDSVSRSQSQSGTSDGVPSGSNVEDPLSGVPVGSIDSTAHFPNTSPFGSATGSVMPVVIGSSPRSGATTTSITNNGVTPGAVALLDLGGGDSLSVSKAVADSLVAAWNDVGATSSSNTDHASRIRSTVKVMIPRIRRIMSFTTTSSMDSQTSKQV